jgi:hypothetical protein
MKAALELGRWVFLAPIGYLNAPRAMGKSLMPDPERAPLVRRAFEEYALEQLFLRVAGSRTAVGSITRRWQREVSVRCMRTGTSAIREVSIDWTRTQMAGGPGTISETGSSAASECSDGQRLAVLPSPASSQDEALRNREHARWMCGHDRSTAVVNHRLSGHSYLSALKGSIFVARRAGT